MRKRKHLADYGSLTLIFGSILVAFLLLSNAIALNGLYSFAPTWPLWIGQLIGGVITFAILAILKATGETLMEVTLRFLIVSTFLWFLLTPSSNSPRGKEMAKWRQQQSPK